MTPLFSPTSSKTRLIEFFIEEYSHWQKPTAFIFKKLNRVFEKPIFNEHRFNALMVAADKCFNHPSPDDFHQDLKNRIEQLSTELEVGKRGYAISHKYEIGNSIHYMLKLIDSNFDDGDLTESTDKNLLILSKGCNVYKYLDKSYWESLRLIAMKFPSIERYFEKVLLVDSRGYEIFNRIKNAIKPVLENPQNRYEEPEAPVIPAPSDVEFLSSIENWEELCVEEPICGPSSSHEVPVKPNNRAKLQLVGIIESITDRILLHYGDTFVRLLTNPLTQAFQTDKLQSIVEDVLSTKAAQFSPEEKKIWKEFLCSSLPSTACNFLSMTTDKMSDPTKGYEFIHGITKMISPFCFKTPEIIGHHHKMLILNILPQITLF